MADAVLNGGRDNLACKLSPVIWDLYEFCKKYFLGPPGAPGAVLVDDISATSGVIHWSDGSTNGAPIKAYTIEGKTNHQPEWVVLRESKYMIFVIYVEKL